MSKKSSNPVRFCWICSTKLWGNHSEVLTIDQYSRTLHKACAKEVKREIDFRKDVNGYYHSMTWAAMGEF